LSKITGCSKVGAFEAVIIFRK